MNTKRFRPAELVEGLVPLRERPEYADVLADLQGLERLHAEKEFEKKRILARARGQKVNRTAVERAKDLLAGGRISPTPPGPAVEALDQELDILRGAIIEKTRALDEIARDLAYAESEKVKLQFNEAMRNALAAMEQLSSAFGSAAALADQLRRAGYRPSAVLLPDLTPIAARALGDPESQVSEAYKFRRDLEELVLRFSHMIQPIPVRTGRRAVSSRWAANHPSDSVH
jgi:hypothetical protein